MAPPPTSSRRVLERSCTPSTRRASPTGSRTICSTIRTCGASDGACAYEIGEPPMSETLPGAQILCRELIAAGVDVIFGYPGGAIMPFYHALPEYAGLRHI